ncbi:hypothetical protein, conserved [Trypanosoma brucei brucei TREU927]|uniref:SET domain-containing protein n=1 Tax=Trypanosoma brucei brucei (strain 927/4 GUTat10.1) TaxID=185431 RepID=Q389M6_TRYB2|nr:hypothetical protein, conserved [Trypanosoma brucei brucei TREU927]EAN78494.1 hypothetical protein, conserved [Trypanosoma brucei brucei TREU927]
MPPPSVGLLVMFDVRVVANPPGMSWVEDKSRDLESLRKRLKECGHDAESLTIVGRKLHEIAEQAHRKGEWGTLGVESGSGRDEEQAFQLFTHAGELLMRTVISILESFTQHEIHAATRVRIEKEEVDIIETLMRAANTDKTCSALSTLHCRWRRVYAASRAWRWCEAHVTLTSDYKPDLCSGGLYDMLPMTEWWWMPETVSAMTPPKAEATSSMCSDNDDGWLLFEDLFLSTTAPQSSECKRQLHDAETVTAFLNELNSTVDLFSRRIPAGYDELRRLYIGKADIQLQQARLFSHLSFVKGVPGSYQNATDGKTVVSGGVNGCHKLLWISREGLSTSMRCLIDALTAAQIAVAQFNAPCDDLIRRIRLAMFGVGLSSDGEGDTPHSACTPLLHPSVEPSSNRWRIKHGVGLIATNHIMEGAVVVKDRSLLLVGQVSPQKRKQERVTDIVEAPDGENAAVVNGALELFLRGGFVHKDELATSSIVKALRVGKLLGDPVEAPDMHSALHLLAMMPFSGESGMHPTQGAGRENVDYEAAIARDLADLMCCWRRCSVPLEAPQDFRATPKAEVLTPCRALLPLVSLINHSCKPNAIILPLCSEESQGSSSFGEGKGDVCVIALRDIEPGEEITVSYLSSVLIPKTLKDEQNGFCCCCSFCKSSTALLEGVICPECRQLIYDPEDAQKNCDKYQGSAGRQPTRGVHTYPCVLVDLSLPKGQRSYEHASDCSRADSDTYESLSRRILQGYANAVDKACEEFESTSTFGGVGASACEVEVEAGTVGSSEEVQGIEVDGMEEGSDDDDNGAGEDRLAQTALRRLMDLDSFACALPTTHYIRLQTRLECLALSLRSQLTTHDSHMLLLLCEELLEDLRQILPPNHPLLTGVRLQYALARSRHFAESADSSHTTEKHDHGCCGGVRECAATLSLPFLRDGMIRECIVHSFQEFYTTVGWKHEGCTQRELLSSFLEEYAVELLMCGIESIDHMTLLSLVYDASQEASVGL